MNNLILVRHGQSKYNLERRFTGFYDIYSKRWSKKMANKNTTLKELIQDIDYRLTHLEDISADNRSLMVKMIKQGNQIVEFLRRFDIEEVIRCGLGLSR